MADPSIHINYSFEDIQRYLQGKMSAAEMHNIEKAALQDPFLADAIEGYYEVDAGIAKQHLNEINAGLFAEEKTSKVISFNRKTKWLRIAAMLFVVAGIGVLGTYIFKKSDTEQQVAQAKKEADNNTLNDSAPAIINTSPEIKKEEPVVAQNQSRPKTPATEKKPAAKNLAKEDKGAKNEAANVTTMMAYPADSEQRDYASRSFNETGVSANNNDSIQQPLEDKISGVIIAPNVFSGKVVDENNKPVAGAVVESADKKTAVVTDLNGDFKLRKNDSLLAVTASTIGYERAKARLQSGNKNAIVLKQNDTAISDVVVVGYGAAKTKTSNKAASPVGGWENFNNYVLRQINKDSSNLGFISNDDIVEIEFLIDKAGNPYEFKILKSLDNQHNAKAIEILKSGPKWTNYSSNNKTRVSIAF